MRCSLASGCLRAAVAMTHQNLPNIGSRFDNYSESLSGSAGRGAVGAITMTLWASSSDDPDASASPFSNRLL